MAIDDTLNPSDEGKESNLKKLENLFRGAAEKLGRGITNSPEEHAVLHVLQHALAPEELCEGKLRNSRYGVSLVYDIQQYSEERVVRDIVEPFLKSQGPGKLEEQYGFRIATASNVRVIDIACPHEEAKKFEKFVSEQGIEIHLLDRNTNTYHLKELP